MTELITVIIPVYKVEEYLDACIVSVINQTYTNLEIILVDDGSPDRCGEICNIWQKKDQRIRVIHKENGGLSDARNAGLQIANGKYILFVDSDDCISPIMAETLFSALQYYSADIAECDYLSFNASIPDNKTAEEQGWKIFTSEEALSSLLEGAVFKYPVWNKIYSKKVLNNIRFEIGKLHEDVFFTYQAFGQSEKIVKVSKKLYYYRQRENSIMGSVFSMRNLDALEARCKQYCYIREKYPDLSEKALKHLLGSCLYLGQIYDSIQGDMCREQALKRIQEIFTEYFQKENMSLNVKDKIWFNLAKKNIKIVCRIRNLLRIGI